MNFTSRCIIVIASAAVCAGGWVSVARENVGSGQGSGQTLGDLECGYKFASTDLRNFSFAQLEEIVRADAATRFPDARLELGSVKAERGVLSMTVVLFGPNRQAQAVLYALMPDKNSWKISSTRRLWFVPPSQIARGLRV